MRKHVPLLLLLTTVTLNAFGGTTVKPTTTLAAQTGNNTSAADRFAAQTNGNTGAGNVSKVASRTMLYPGSTAKIYAHWMPWFGTASHMDVGYDSADPTQIERQITDMQSRGIGGVIADWYGPANTHINTATMNMMNAAQSAGGKFEFAIMEDGGALTSCANTSGCDVTQKLIDHLTYVYNTFEPSSAYMRVNGRPVIFFFGVERYSPDWTRVRSNTPGNPLFVFQNAGAYTKYYSDGGFSWVQPASDPTNINLAYLDNFYATAQTYPLELTFATGYKGFNDTLAAWGKNRIMNQDCGQTWLRTLQEISRYYSSSDQLDAIQLVTWNDYEEGSEIETGIDNCVNVSGAVGGNVASWSISGQENTVDHYTVYISLDGQNLMPLSDVAAGTHSLDLTPFSFGPANYTLYVQAVGKPSLTNKMSAGIPWTVANQPPVARLAVTPGTGVAPVTVSADASASSDTDGTIAGTMIDFGDGTVANSATASHSYTSSGIYTIKATVTDDLGATSTSTSVVTISAPTAPTVALKLSATGGVVPMAITANVSASSTNPDGTITGVQINWGDGSAPVSGWNATHTYTKAGTYTVTATATDSYGQSTSVTSQVFLRWGVRILSPASGAITPSPVRVKATASSYAPITCMKIYRDNVQVYSANNVSQIDTSLPMSAGAHTLVVQAWDAKGNIYKTPVSITVK